MNLGSVRSIIILMVIQMT